MTRIALLTMGTRGDVQPFLALAKGLRARGHDVVLAGPDRFADWVRGHGVAFHGIGVDIDALVQSEEAQAALAGRWLKARRIFQEQARPIMRATLEAVCEIGRDAHVLVHHPKMFVAADLAEATGAVPVMAAPVPIYPTAAFPVIALSRNLGATLNRLTWSALKLARLPYRGLIDAWRRDRLGLGPGPRFGRLGARLGAADGALMTRLCAVSPAVVPRPEDWDPDIHMTGYLFLDEGADWTPDPALATFLAAGPPPVYIGFGSMPLADRESLSVAVAQAVRRAGLRAILAEGWGGLSAGGAGGDAGGDAGGAGDGALHVLEAAPHDALFPLVSAVVHHGGAGSTAAGLRAGKPTLICPFGVDQPFWGRIVAQIDAGPPPLPAREISPDRFAAALTQLVETRSYAETADRISREIAAEDGVARAIALIEAAATSSA